jgi:hypothetical protein
VHETDDLDSWQWNGQLVPAALGAALTAIALTLGFTSRRRAYHAMLAISIGCALIWYLWVGSDDFARTGG